MDEPTPPVFADPSGVRRRRMRRVSYIVVTVLVVLLVAFWLSQLSVNTPAGLATTLPGGLP